MAGGIVGGALIALLAGGSLAAASAATEPYAMRGIALGITLGQFREIPYPDHRQHATARIVCSSDPTAAGLDALHLTPNLVEADVVKCGYFQPGFGGGTAPRIAAPVQFLGEEVTPLFLFYRQPGAALHRLTQITFAMGNRRTDEVIALFRRAFGKLPELQVTSVQTGFGPQLADIIYIWQNGASTLRLDTVTVVLNQMGVVFFDDHLGASLDNRLDTIARRNRAAAEELAKANGEEVPQDSEAAAPKDAAKPATGKPTKPSFGHDLLGHDLLGGDPLADEPAKPEEKVAKKEPAAKTASPAAAISPALAGMTPTPGLAGPWSGGDAPGQGEAAPTPSPSYIEPPLNLPSSFGSFTFK